MASILLPIATYLIRRVLLLLISAIFIIYYYYYFVNFLILISPLQLFLSCRASLLADHGIRCSGVHPTFLRYYFHIRGYLLIIILFLSFFLLTSLFGLLPLFQCHHCLFFSYVDTALLLVALGRCYYFFIGHFYFLNNFLLIFGYYFQVGCFINFDQFYFNFD